MRLSKRAQAVRPSATLATGQRARELQAAGVDVINLSVGQPDFPTPAPIKAQAVSAINAGRVDGYTDTAGILPLREAVSQQVQRLHGVDVSADQVVVTTGAKLALYALCQVLLDPGDEVLLPKPYWVSYAEQVGLAGGRPVTVDSNANLKVTPVQLAQAYTPRTRALILNSPQNPSGVVYTREELQAIGQWAVARDVLIIADDIYGELVYDGSAVAPSIVGITPAITAQTVLIGGVSKTYAMTGWRIGYAIGQPALIQAMKTVLSHMTGNAAAVSQVAAQAALTMDQASVASMRADFKRRRDAIYPLLTALPGFHLATKPQGAFYFFPDVTAAMAIKQVTTSSEFVAKVLEEAHVAVVAGEAFGMPGYIRLSYASSLPVLLTAMDRLKQFMQD
ncbi:pyridoxal phosphate-dependent aminotransferase [Levilactobacillus huananensis]|uniref:pyridoxal phosphate-dependent aminotransferase n=1 Tax=Levilactobacillus huananensis TaxID=2486019 RepID=UPI000F77E1AF|nr:pyridoxal phosphate-dependent aminotransferase [Levilactobacillus huananensis]